MGKITHEGYYNKQNVEYTFSLINQGHTTTESVKQMCAKFNLPYNENVSRAYRRWSAKKTEKTPLADELKTAKERKFNKTTKRFLITWAQQDTVVHKEMLANLEAYAAHINADLHVIAGVYKNPTSLSASKAQEKKNKNKNNWDQSVIQYLDANRQNIHKYLTILADVKVQPTASTPLSGFNGITALESCIIGHPAIHLKSLPVLDSYPSKLLLTTGAITLPNYTDSKAGAKAKFHHTLGFVVVELSGEIFHVRQVQVGEDGSFYDLNSYVANGSVSQLTEKCPAVVFGDLHLTEEDEVSVKRSFEIADWSRAEKIILHDVFNGHSVSHHEQGNPVVLAQREQDGSWDLKKELAYVTDWFEKHSKYSFVSVMSNHTAWLDRWILSNDWRKSPNRGMYLELAHAAVEGKAPKGLIPYILDRFTNNVLSLSYNDSYRLGEWELALHGDFGTSGSRGSIMQFKNLNTKTIVGHAHQPARELGCIQVGTLTKLRLGYNNGLSAWLNGVVLIYPNGKASHIHIIKGRYTTLF